MSDVNLSTPVEYRLIPEFPGYRASNLGKIQSARWKRTRADSPMASEWKDLRAAGPNSRKPYLYVALMRDGKRISRRVHSLVLEAFVGPRPPGMECRHLNGDVRDCRPENLAWGTHVENENDKCLHGTRTALKGSDAPRAKLRDEDIPAIWQLRLQGVPGREIARRFSVGHSTIDGILNGRTWKHLTNGLQPNSYWENRTPQRSRLG